MLTFIQYLYEENQPNEEVPDQYVYHGGTYKGGEYNPHARGEPGDLRPMGRGIYTGATEGHAGLYTKYATNGTVQKFRIKKGAKIYPFNGAAWRASSPSEQTFWKEKSKEIQVAFEQAGLVRKNTFSGEYYAWSLAVSTTHDNKTRELIRQKLVELGIDGAKEILHPEIGMIEFCFYNTNVLIPA